MTLDLDELILGWDCPAGELRARLVVGRDGQELLQLRLDLGVMQMFPAGRPDGQRYRGLPDALAFVRHELRVGGTGLSAADWRELVRELQQINYRRLAFAALLEDALRANDTSAAARFIAGALADIDACAARLDVIAAEGADPGGAGTLRPTLIFERARLRAQRHLVDGRHEHAVEEAEHGAAELSALLRDLGYEEDMREDDPGVRYLRDLGGQLRLEYGIAQTLHERLEDALAREDFETAAEIRDALRRGEAGHSDPSDDFVA
jgi:hypothetical protein